MESDKAFILSINKIRSAEYSVVILTANKGKIYGVMKTKVPPMITSFGIAEWWEVKENRYIKLEQLLPSPILSIFDTDKLVEVSYMCQSFDSEDFNAFCAFVEKITCLSSG